MSRSSQTAAHRDVSLYSLKSRFVQALEPIRRLLAARAVAPTTITIAAIPVEVAVALFLVVGSTESWFLVLVPFLTVCWMGLNALDGSLARSTGRATPRGAVINELVDRLGDILLICTAAIVTSAPLAALLAVMVLGSELVAAIGWAITGRRGFAGPMGKPDRAAVVAVGAVAAIVWSEALTAAFALVAVGSAIGLGVRTRAVLNPARSLESGDVR